MVFTAKESIGRVSSINIGAGVGFGGQGNEIVWM
jgi:hypothetical protein